MSNILTNLISRQSIVLEGREALRYKNPDGSWSVKSWLDLNRDVADVSAAFVLLGIKPQDMLAVFSANCPEIIVTDFACYRNRAVTVSIYSTSSIEQVKFIINDACVRMIMVGGQRQYDIVRGVLDECPALERIIVFDEDVRIDANDNTTMTFTALRRLGETASDIIRGKVGERAMAATPDDIATLIYTSGTTGEPKGAILPHSCFDAALEIHRKRLTMLSDQDISLCFLPLCHIFEKAWTYFCLFMGIRVVINNDPREIQDVIGLVRPTCMCSVPRFWEKVYAAVQEKLGAVTGVKKLLAKRALRVGAERNLYYKRTGRNVPKMLERRYQFYDRLVLAPIRRAIGVDNGNIFPTAGAPLSENIVEFFHTIGINIVVGYGLSETTATVSCFPETGFEIGSVGTILPGIEVKLGKDDEILVKGPTVMRGYYNRPKATAEAFTEDGWFRTGDAGHFDEAGTLVLTERIKDLFKTSNGKYIAPQAIESRLGEDRYIDQVAVIGDRRKYVTAIIIPAFDALKEYARRHKIAFKTIEDLVQNSEILRFIEQRIERLQKGLAGFEKIKRFTLLSREFTIEGGELTNTLKLRRAVINHIYADEIESMYA